MNRRLRRFSLFCVAGGWLLAVGSLALADEPSVTKLLDALKDSDEAVRINAIDQLGSLGVKAAPAVVPLTEALQDKSAAVRANAAWALGKIGAPAKSAGVALVALLKDPDIRVRGQVVTALTEIRPGAQLVLPAFIKLMEESDDALRLRVLNAVAEAGEVAVPGLIKALKNDKTAYPACVVLRDLGPVAKDAVPALTEKLADSHPEIRREAVLALAAIGSAAAPAIPKIVALLDDEQLQAPATYALVRLGKIPADAEVKIRANTKSADKHVSTTSSWALAMVHPADKQLRREATEKLVDALKSKDSFVRVTAARALAALPPAPEIAIPIFEKAFKDADEATLHHALDALAGLGPAAVPRLIEVLKHAGPGVRIEVATILGRMGPAAAPATEALAKLILDKEPSDDKAVLMALASIGPGAKAAVPALIQVLKQGDSPVTYSVIYTLGRIGPDSASATTLLEGNLKSTDASLALVSAWALAQIHPASAETAAKTVPVLITGLVSPLPQARQGAAEALGDLGSLAKDAVPALQKASRDEDKAVRDAASHALKAIGGSAGVRKSAGPLRGKRKGC